MNQNEITDKDMEKVYEEFKTPYKKGMVLCEEKVWMDCPNVFVMENGVYGMVYVRFWPDDEQPGYDTWLAKSTDLLHWTPVGKLLERKGSGWDGMQVDGSVCLIEPDWEKESCVKTCNGKYWMTYIGGSLPGYETDPLSMGLACGEKLEPGSMEQMLEPILSNTDKDVRAFERTTLYKSNVFYDETMTLGHPYVMFYNGKAGTHGIEKIGIAVSDDMRKWKRYGEDCVLQNDIEDRWNIAGDPQIIRWRDLWIMHYFIAKDGTAYDTFACSRDLVHWKKWGKEPLVKPSEDFDSKYAHKPFLIKADGVVYHFYCAVGEKGRGIAVATSSAQEKSEGNKSQRV